ncbi:MAG: hypothetical protein R2795_08155 [Saprospiraceae bacterium]
MENQSSEKSWLEQLATESWQAELVISGVALYGAFQLSAGVDQLIDWLFFTLPESLAEIAYFAGFYLIIAVITLSASFLVHFIVRAIWIASIGLESVYPNGINMDTDLFGEHFKTQLKKEYPDFNAFNANLDKVASSILANALSLVMAFAGIGILMGGMLFIGYLTAVFSTEKAALYVVTALIGIFVAALLFGVALSIPKLRDKEWVKKIHFPLMRYVGMVYGNIFQQPISWFSYVTRTNTDKKAYLKNGIIIFIVITVVSGYKAINSNLLSLMPNHFARESNITERMYNRHYESKANESLAFVYATIPAPELHYLSDLRLFIPMPYREERRIMENCDTPEPPETDDRSASRKAQYVREISCYREKIKVLIDNKEVNCTIYIHTHPHRKEYGLLYYFPDLVLSPGEHVLQIEHTEVKYEGKTKKESISFLYLPK